MRGIQVKRQAIKEEAFLRILQSIEPIIALILLSMRKLIMNSNRLIELANNKLVVLQAVKLLELPSKLIKMMMLLLIVIMAQLHYNSKLCICSNNNNYHRINKIFNNNKRMVQTILIYAIHKRQQIEAQVKIQLQVVEVIWKFSLFLNNMK